MRLQFRKYDSYRWLCSYQITMHTMYVLLETDIINTILTIVFRGMAEAAQQCDEADKNFKAPFLPPRQGCSKRRRSGLQASSQVVGLWRVVAPGRGRGEGGSGRPDGLETS
jgi:hypothetical protein